MSWKGQQQGSWGQPAQQGSWGKGGASWGNANAGKGGNAVKAVIAGKGAAAGTTAGAGKGGYSSSISSSKGGYSSSISSSKGGYTSSISSSKGAAASYGKGAATQRIAPAAPAKAPWQKPAAPQPTWQSQQARPANKGAGKAAQVAASSLAPKPDRGVEFRGKVTKLTKELDSTSTAATTTLKSSKLLLENEKSTAVAMKSSCDSLEKHQTKLNEIMKSLSTESTEARKAGPSAAASVTEFSKLLTKLRATLMEVTAQVTKLKPKMIKMQKDGENKAKEVKDLASFKAVLAKAKADVITVESVANEVAKKAAPLVSSPPEAGEEGDKKIAAVEEAAAAAVKKLEAVRSELNEKVKSIQTFAPEAKKTSGVSLMELIKKVSTALRANTVYRSFKAQLPRLAESQKNITEVSEQLAGHEAAIAKATDLAKVANLTKGKVEAIDGELEPVLKAARDATAALLKLRNADAVTQEQITKLRTRADELKKKCEAVTTTIKGPRDAIKAEEGVETAKSMVEKAETHWKECQEAEMPFLMGVEVLASAMNDKALQECQDAATATGSALGAARNHIKQKLTESKTYEKELAASTASDLNSVLKEVEEMDAKYIKYRKELAERKLIPILSDAIDAVATFEQNVKAAEAVAKPLDASGLENQALASFSEALEQTKTAFKEANDSGLKARNLAQVKQRESKANSNHPSIVSINEGLTDAQSRLTKVQGNLKKAEQLAKTQNNLTSGEERVKEAEAAVETATKLVPTGDFSLDTVKAVDEACAAARKLINGATSIVQPAIASASPKATEAKASLQKLLERKDAALKAITELIASTKDRREAAVSGQFVADAESKIKAAETAAASMEEAEAPFLIGSTLSTKATTELLEKCIVAARAVQEAMTAAKTHSAQKANESRQFGAAAATKVKEAFAKHADRLKEVADKLAIFQKDSTDRTKDNKMAETVENGDELEACVKKTLAAAEPFTKEGAENMSEADALVPLNAFLEADKEAQQKLIALNSLLLARQKEQKGNKEHEDTLKTLQERVAKAREEIAEKKKAIAPHEKRALGKRLLAEIKEQVAGLDAHVKKATDACAPLLAEGGEQFLISNSVRSLATALQVHMKTKELSVEDVFKAVNKGKAVSEKALVKFLEELAIEHDELSAFSGERRLAIFKSLASNNKAISQEDFAGIFREECHCVKAVVVTDKFEVEGAETLVKVMPNMVVETFGRQRETEGGLTRSECKVDDKTGWITVHQKGLSKFLTVTSAYTAFGTLMDKALAEGGSSVNKVSSSLLAKMKQGGPAEEGPLKEAREEMAKLREDITKAQKAIQELQAKVRTSRSAFVAKETSERNAHIDARNQKEAAPFLAEPKAKIDAFLVDAKGAEEAGAPMMSLSAEELQKFATPASVMEAVEKFAAGVKAKGDAAREAIKEQREAVSKVTPQSGGTIEAKKQLAAMSGELAQWASKIQKTSNVISSKCKTLTSAKLDPTADAIRKHAAKIGKSIEEFFDSLKTDDKIPEEAFCKMLASLEVDGTALSPEIAKLVCRKLGADGISKDTFMTYVVLYFKVVRTIAFTDSMDISTCKTLRKGAEGEVVEVLEGPVFDAANSMTRIRARSLKADKQEGWITLSGSKGTAFLEKTSKP